MSGQWATMEGPDVPERKMSPTPDPTAPFRTHASYVAAFAHLATDGGSLADALDNTAAAIASWPSPADKPGPTPDLTVVRRSLQHAWGTELIQGHNLSIADDELVRLTNTWSIVQTYYVAYHATQALWVALGHDRPTAHPKTQSLFVDLWATRNLHLPPLTLGVGATGATNLPAGVTVEAVHNWTWCDSTTCWSLAAKALQSTRKERLRERQSSKRDEKQADNRKAWKEDEAAKIAKGRTPRKVPKFSRPQLTSSETATIATSTRTYGLIDYLYRLRVRANYVDASIFTDGPDDQFVSTILAENLVTLSSVVLMGHEHRIGVLVGSATLLDWMDKFIAKNALPSDAVIRERRARYPII